MTLLQATVLSIVQSNSDTVDEVLPNRSSIAATVVGSIASVTADTSRRPHRGRAKPHTPFPDRPQSGVPQADRSLGGGSSPPGGSA